MIRNQVLPTEDIVQFLEQLCVMQLVCVRFLAMPSFKYVPLRLSSTLLGKMVGRYNLDSGFNNLIMLIHKVENA